MVQLKDAQRKVEASPMNKGISPTGSMWILFNVNYKASRPKHPTATQTTQPQKLLTTIPAHTMLPFLPVTHGTADDTAEESEDGGREGGGASGDESHMPAQRRLYVLEHQAVPHAVLADDVSGQHRGKTVQCCHSLTSAQDYNISEKSAMTFFHMKLKTMLSEELMSQLSTYVWAYNCLIHSPFQFFFFAAERHTEEELFYDAWIDSSHHLRENTQRFSVIDNRLYYACICIYSQIKSSCFWCQGE